MGSRQRGSHAGLDRDGLQRDAFSGGPSPSPTPPRCESVSEKLPPRSQTRFSSLRSLPGREALCTSPRSPRRLCQPGASWASAVGRGHGRHPAWRPSSQLRCSPFPPTPGGSRRPAGRQLRARPASGPTAPLSCSADPEPIPRLRKRRPGPREERGLPEAERVLVPDPAPNSCPTYSSQKPGHTGDYCGPIARVSTRLLREVEELAQGHTARPDPSPGNPTRCPGRRVQGRTQSPLGEV